MFDKLKLKIEWERLKGLRKKIKALKKKYARKKK